VDWRLAMAETPFGQNTRQNFRDMNSITYVTSGRDTEPIPRVGYLARIRMHFNGTITVVLGGGTAAIDVMGPHNMLNRVRVTANSGQDIYSTTGYGLYLTNRCLINGWDYDPSSSRISVAYASQIYQAAAASGANTWDLNYTIPIALNNQSELGLLLLQNRQAETQLALEWNALYSLTAAQAPILVTGAATATGTGVFYPTLEYFSVPANPKFRPDITWIHQIIEKQQPVSGVGDQIIDHLKENTYLQILHHMVLNNAPNTTDLDRLRLVLNTSDTPYDFTKRALLDKQRYDQHSDLPVGVFLLDFFKQETVGYGSRRDNVQGKAATEMWSNLTINSAATIGSNARISTITRQIVKLNLPPVRAA
jgi:hypothetical protein